MSENILPEGADLARARRLLDDLPGMVYRCENAPGWPMEFVSAGSFALAGLRPDELTSGKVSWREVVLPEDRESLWSGVQDALSRHEPFELSYRIRDVAGNEKWVREHGRAVRRPDGTVAALEGFISDATPGRRAETEYRTILQTAPSGFWLFDGEGRLLDVNDAYGRISGFGRDELLRMTVSDFDPPEVRAKAAADRELLFSDGSAELQARQVRKDGTRIDVEIWARALPGADRRYVAFLRDVTARLRMEAQIRESEERFRRVFEDAPIGVSLTAVDGSLSRVNRAFADMLGYTPEELARVAWSEVTHPDDRDASAELVRTVLAGDASTGRLEKRYLARDGTVVWAVVHTTLLRDAEGRPKHFVTQVHDITDRKKAEEQLRETKEFHESLVSYANAPIVVWGPDLRITRFNHAFERLTGIREEEAVGSRLDVLFPDARRAEAMELVRRASTGERLETVEIPIRAADGGVRTVLWNSATIFAPGGTEPRATIAQGQDVTEAVAARRDLSLRAEELARSNEELEQFAYVASHDLQEPLRTVASYVQLLSRRYKDRLDADANDFIDFATEGAVRMQRLIEDLLVYSRVGTRGRAFADVDSGEAFRSAIRALGQAVRESRAEVTHDPLPRVFGDAGQLTQLLQNLVGNALKFHGESPPRVHVSARRDGAEWRFSVTDHGIGIAPEHFDRIFRVFQRLHGREDYPGTGIGLAVCKKIVERHGGRIGVESAPGHGATFWFTLPSPQEKP
ncbi:MAG: PAS domain-containing sensor histidine kinase [Thermoanaerobaculia bacterium]